MLSRQSKPIINCRLLFFSNSNSSNQQFSADFKISTKTVAQQRNGTEAVAATLFLTSFVAVVEGVLWTGWLMSFLWGKTNAIISVLDGYLLLLMIDHYQN